MSYDNKKVSGYRNLVEALEAAPRDRVFVTHWIDEDEQYSVTFGEFRERVRCESSALRGHGVSAGDRVVILIPQGIAAMTAFVASMMIGAIPAFLAYPNFKVEAAKYREGLAGVTANLGAKAVILDKEFPEDMLAYVAVGTQTSLIRTGQEGKCSSASGGRASEAPIQGEDLAFIQHSAGTTGLQKGVALSHAAVLRQLGHLAGAIHLDSCDRIYSWLPLYHDMGLIACFMLPMVCHVPLVMQSPIDWVMQPEALLRIVSDFRCTVAWMPNFAFQFVPRRVPQERWPEYDLSSLRLLINCSEPVRATSMDEFQKAFQLRDGVLQSSYAMAENVFAVTQSGIDGSAGPARVWLDGRTFRGSHRIAPVAEGTPGALLLTSSGRLLSGQRVRIVGDSGMDSRDDCVGEILIQSDCLFDGYYNRPDLTENVLNDGWYWTGDLGFLRDGELYVVGRKKDLLIIGGENIYPQDIEEIVSSHAAIHDGRAVAMGIYSPNLGTEEIFVVAEVEDEVHMRQQEGIENELRSRIVAGLGIAVKGIFLKPEKWIVKSTAGKAARAATRAKLLQEHPELNGADTL